MEPVRLRAGVLPICYQNVARPAQAKPSDMQSEGFFVPRRGWCRRSESNGHGLTHWFLSLVRVVPISVINRDLVQSPESCPSSLRTWMSCCVRLCCQVRYQFSYQILVAMPMDHSGIGQTSRALTAISDCVAWFWQRTTQHGLRDYWSFKWYFPDLSNPLAF